MNILLIIPENTGTIAKVSFNLYKGLLDETNHNIFVVCLGNYSTTGFIFQNCFHLGNFIKNKNIARIFLLKKIKRKYNIDISISTLTAANYLNVLSSIKEYKIGIFHTSFEQTRTLGLIKYYVFSIFNKLLIPYLDKKVAVNKTALQSLLKLRGCSELIYNIHDFDLITEQSKISLDYHEELIFSKPVILYVGSGFYHVKAPDRLLKAFIKLKRNDVNLVFVGKDFDHTFDKLNAIINNTDVLNNVFFLGFQSNPYKFMRRASMVVSPSRDEGLPGILIESLSIGTKCIATNSSIGVWEIMECDDNYNKSMTGVYKTKYGYIVPNNLESEEDTINFLVEAINECFVTQFPKVLNFNINRFSSKSIIPSLLSQK